MGEKSVLRVKTPESDEFVSRQKKGWKEKGKS